MKSIFKIYGSIILALILVFVGCDDNKPCSHTWGEWTVTTAPTCVATGTGTRVCAQCAVQDSNTTIPIDGSNHDWEITSEDPAPTCEEDGFGSGHCKREGCEATIEDDVLPALGHDFTVDWINDADGHWKGCKNKGCKSISIDGTNPSDDKADHISNNAQAANCLDPDECEVCGYEITKAKDSHKYPSNDCTALCEDCGTANNAQHNYEFTNTVDPTCTEDGYDLYTCSRCDNTEQREIEDAFGHNIVWVTSYTSIEDNKCNNTDCTHIAGLGDIGPAGGIIFYVISDGFTVLGNGSDESLVGIDVGFDEYKAHYLEVAPSNSGTVQWGASGTLIPGVTVTSGSHADYNKIGNGRKDTRTIVAYLADYTTETNRAAQVVAAATFGGKNDWFLPSTRELNLLYLNKDKLDGKTEDGITGMGSLWFWSSSQGNSNYAWSQDFVDDNRGYFSKNGSYSVRAVRAF